MINLNYKKVASVSFLMVAIVISSQISAKESQLDLGWQGINADYYSYMTTATNTIRDSESFAASGIIRLAGNYNFSAGSRIRFKVEHRDTFTSTTPKDFVFNSVGAVGLIVPQFSDQGFRLTNLYWEKQFNNNQTEMTLGFLDTTNYLDLYMLGNPWGGFNNFIFSTGAGSLTMPDEATLGVTLRHMFTDNIYGLASITDANSLSTEPFDDIFKGGNLFKSLEFGWVPSLRNFYSNNVHILYWELDGGTRHSEEKSSGVNFSWVHKIDNIVPFIRAGVSDGDASLISTSITTGVGYFLADKKSSVGLAFGWGKPNKKLFKTQFEEQYTTELYYKTTVFNALTLTPNIQYLKGLPFNEEESSAWVFGVRMSLSF